MGRLLDEDMVIDAVSRGCQEFRGIFAECEKNLNELPSAQPDVPDTAFGNMISRQAAIDALERRKDKTAKGEIGSFYNTIIQHDIDVIVELPSAQPEYIQNNAVHLCDSCQYTYATCPSHGNDAVFGDGKGNDNICACNKYRPISAQPEKEIPKRVLWNGWKGMRDTRYKCPNCKKPVRNTDIYCHRCGQKLMFPNIDFTPYVEGQKQELIVRWDDEE